MYPINDRQYLKICAEIAKLMSISLSSAKKKVEIQIAKEGSKTIQEKIQVAQNVLKICETNNGDKLSFRCFAMDINKNVLYLPAFGDLTGGYSCKKSFKKWAIVSEEEIIENKS